jgi:hypothetical protein
VIGRRGCTGRDLNEETLAADNGRWQSSKKGVAYESDVSEGVQVTVLFNLKMNYILNRKKNDFIISRIK